MSSVILLAIVLAWGVVLVPMLLRRHETVSETRSVERFASAMRVLSRRDPSAREVVMPERPESTASVHVKGDRSDPSDRAEAVRSRLRRTRDWSEPTAEADYDRPPAPYAGGRRVVARRRRTLLVLLAAAALQVAGIVLLGPGFWIGQGVCDVLIVGYLAHVRRDVAKARARRQRLAERLAAGRREAERAAARRNRDSGYATAAPPPAHLSEPAAAPATREVVIEKAQDGSWHPVPVPPPTYVTAPPAPPQRERTTAAAGLDANEPVAGEEGFDGIGGYGRRAVNGW